MDQQEAVIESLKAEIRVLNLTSRAKEQRIAELEKELKESRQKISELESQISKGT